MNEIVYRPEASWIQNSHLVRLTEKLRLKSVDELYDFSQRNTEEFWQAALNDMGFEWSAAPKQLLSQGLPWPKWATDGKLSPVHLCIDRHLKNAAQKKALIFEADLPNQNHSWTYEDLARESSYIAQLLKDEGARPGERVALLMPMSLEMVAAFFGVLRAGLTVIPIFSGYGAEAIAARLTDADVKYVFLQEKTTRRGKEVNVEATLNEALTLSPNVKKVWKTKREEFLRGHRNQAILPPHAFSSEDECLFLYTSGTTGKPKACVHTPFGIMATTGKELRYGFDLKSEDTFFWYTDIGWMMGPWELLGALQYGSTVVLFEGVPDFPDATRIWKILDEQQVTHLGISPTAVRVLKKADENSPDRFRFEKLRILGSTGEPWDAETWMWYFQKVGKKKCPIINISGGTEIMGCLLMPAVTQPLKPTTLGRPALGVRAEAWDENGNSLKEGLGHLVCLSPLPSMTKGFLHSPQKYLDTYFEKFGSNVWYHGDWALIDAEGFWYLKGRSDDTIKIAGKRVGPNEFESALMTDPRVAEVAAVGIPHALKGECVHCFVVLKAAHSSGNEKVAGELKEVATKAMGKALAPEAIHVTTALPKTRSGKILRGLIRKVILNEPVDDSAVDSPQTLDAIRQAIGK